MSVYAGRDRGAPLRRADRGREVALGGGNLDDDARDQQLLGGCLDGGLERGPGRSASAGTGRSKRRYRLTRSMRGDGFAEQAAITTTTQMASPATRPAPRPRRNRRRPTPELISCSERFMLVLRDGGGRTCDRVPGPGRLRLISHRWANPTSTGTSPSASVLPNRGDGVHGAGQPGVPSLTRPWTPAPVNGSTTSEAVRR